MKQNVLKNKNLLKSILCFVLIAVMALSVCGCAKEQVEKNPPVKQSSTVSNVTELGEGKNSFNFTVTHKSGRESEFIVNTDTDTVGEALLDVGLIAGEDGAYGLYVKTVNGETLDYDKDGMYWAFYQDGAYAQKGVDQTEIVDGATYSFKAEK